jgi:hypothetical protein
VSNVRAIAKKSAMQLQRIGLPGGRTDVGCFCQRQSKTVANRLGQRIERDWGIRAAHTDWPVAISRRHSRRTRSINGQSTDMTA